MEQGHKGVEIIPLYAGPLIAAGIATCAAVYPHFPKQDFIHPMPSLLGAPDKGVGQLFRVAMFAAAANNDHDALHIFLLPAWPA